MIPDRDIYHAATLFIRKYGRHAQNHAAMWADAMLEACILDGYAVWNRILRAVEDLQGVEPGARVH